MTAAPGRRLWLAGGQWCQNVHKKYLITGTKHGAPAARHFGVIKEDFPGGGLYNPPYPYEGLNLIFCHTLQKLQIWENVKCRFLRNVFNRYCHIWGNILDSDSSIIIYNTFFIVCWDIAQAAFFCNSL